MLQNFDNSLRSAAVLEQVRVGGEGIELIRPKLVDHFRCTIDSIASCASWYAPTTSVATWRSDFVGVPRGYPGSRREPVAQARLPADPRGG
jgi:hypothetical protein